MLRGRVFHQDWFSNISGENFTQMLVNFVAVIQLPRQVKSLNSKLKLQHFCEILDSNKQPEQYGK